MSIETIASPGEKLTAEQQLETIFHMKEQIEKAHYSPDEIDTLSEEINARLAK